MLLIKQSSCTLFKKNARMNANLSGIVTSTANPDCLPRIRVEVCVGFGGSTYKQWRNNFYPLGLPQNQKPAFASRNLSSIEVNGTCCSTFKPVHLYEIT